MARLKEIVIDAENPYELARFWANLLDGFEIRGYDQSEIERLEAIGKTPETDPSVAVDGPGIVIFFKETTRRKTERGRIHLDVIGDSHDVEVARATGLGASIKAERESFTVLKDPEGNEFCIQAPKPESAPSTDDEMTR